MIRAANVFYGIGDTSRSLRDRLFCSGKKSIENNKNYQFLSIIKKCIGALSCFISQELYVMTGSFDATYIYTILLNIIVITLLIPQLFLKSFVENPKRSLSDFLYCFRSLSTEKTLLVSMALVCDIFLMINAFVHSQVVFLLREKKNIVKTPIEIKKASWSEKVNEILTVPIQYICSLMIFLINLGARLLRLNYQLVRKEASDEKAVNIGYVQGLSKLITSFIIFIIQAYLLRVDQFCFTLRIINFIHIINTLFYSHSKNGNIASWFYFSHTFLTTFTRNICVNIVNSIESKQDVLCANIVLMFIQGFMNSVLQIIFSYLNINMIGRVRMLALIAAFYIFIVNIILFNIK